MKIAVPAESAKINSPICSRFARAPCFVVVDNGTDRVAIHDNGAHAEAEHCVAVNVAGEMVDFGVNAVIVRHIGPEAFALLKAENVSVYASGSNTVLGAVEACLAGQLQLLRDADVQSHWAESSC